MGFQAKAPQPDFEKLASDFYDLTVKIERIRALVDVVDVSGLNPLAKERVGSQSDYRDWCNAAAILPVVLDEVDQLAKMADDYDTALHSCVPRKVDRATLERLGLEVPGAKAG
ncbi:hypothetical protein [Sphingomonas sp. 28-63-12]|uniref:hypothetical protein n=1 Tax=Sphingomonas sp. 28-63-12 TaxID=1970434 RepID=UPI000BD462CE|nr:MAG: hypothetical protein B7Y47_02970 [Sphingomonas sp. 28-63-12]